MADVAIANRKLNHQQQVESLKQTAILKHQKGWFGKSRSDDACWELWLSDDSNYFRFQTLEFALEDDIQLFNTIRTATKPSAEIYLSIESYNLIQHWANING